METIPPNDKAFLNINMVQDSMNAHAKRIAIAYGEWQDVNAVRNGFHEWTVGCGASKKSYTSDQLFDYFIELITA